MVLAESFRCLHYFTLIVVHRYDGLEGLVSPDAATLAVSFSDGRIQLLQHEADEAPCAIETNLEII